LRLRNWFALSFDPASIEAVVPHAHIDHDAYLPLVVKWGFTGQIFCSPATLELCRILLPDSGHLQEEEAKFANRRGFSKHKPALPLPLYTPNYTPIVWMLYPYCCMLMWL
jgi:metallo-beta-lactamase family protein